MIRKLAIVALAFFALNGLQIALAADNHGTPEEAKAMVEKAVAQLSTDGKEKAFAVFDDATGPYIDRDLYVFVLDLQGNIVAHGTNKAMIGKSLLNLKDPSGRFFVQEMIKLGETTGEGWVDYSWSNPTSKKIEPKSSFVKKVGDVLVGVGVYKG
jgi:signal transduction histidine kinase